ncbi:hypothetical protein FDI40_gp678 [Agrobacterium phage Atu_ph07]|uniref:Uncharacterized protein n=1 Tax=Agrobacterium phage Atu_ph07 TaxID=2024264 RepID=A0A223W008_9CAUD|nr:hypothetical protein FDI40_gp678 [Agrobacterium phage Atu_ph07]ASV44755.1 hypothetical protein [Agrobacterium phage Atu_ph07]
MQIQNAELAKTFILGGNAIFTVKGKETRYTYRVRKHKENDVWFVGVMFAESNSFFAYIGFIKDGKFTPSNKNYPVTDVRTVSFGWMFDRVYGQTRIPANMEFYHEGKCARCARRLTVPSSIESGFGPECATKIICE